MLVLSRKESEELVISGEIRIRVLRIDRSTIRLGIEAPKHVSIRRAELCDGDRVGSAQLEHQPTDSQPPNLNPNP